METNSLYCKHSRPKDTALKVLINLAAGVTVVVLVGIIGYILVNGLPYVTWQFISTPYSEMNPDQKGILPMIINTLYIVVITLLIAVPIGLSSAIYLTQYAKQGRLVYNGGPFWYPVDHFRPIWLHSVLHPVPLTGFHPCGLPDYDDLYSTDHRAHNGGIAYGGSNQLQRGRACTWRWKVACDPGHRAPMCYAGRVDCHHPGGGPYCRGERRPSVHFRNWL